MAGTGSSDTKKQETLTLAGTISQQIERAEERLLRAQNNDSLGGYKEINAASDHLKRLLRKRDSQ
jgi:hypothetical protein